MKFDLLHIKKYLARQTYYVKCKENEESWKKFKHMSFWQFIYEAKSIPGLGDGGSGSHRRFWPGPVYCVRLSQTLLWEPEVLDPTQDIDLIS